MSESTKLCLICKENISIYEFTDHFIECRKERTKKEQEKIEGTLSVKERRKLKKQKRGGCGCSRKNK